ncbi:MAG TPA: hypothetical protein VFR68_00750 [Candidatus Dormibacteraeota bacterium]|nr:hypothetical protein [Candidatus Dormibacteraeota bacterium]
MARSKKDGVEAVLRKADATLDQWFRRGAGAIRQQVEELQAGLKKLSANLEHMEKSQKAAQSGTRARSTSKASSTTQARSAATRKAARPRRPKKAA